jgi:ATP-dependent exoDNAse (exonuclease V) alpha subunit
MIAGGPGSGKKETIARILLLANKLKQKVILLGPNNKSLDSILERMISL